jgi:hypothetical protein
MLQECITIPLEKALEIMPKGAIIHGKSHFQAFVKSVEAE